MGSSILVTGAISATAILALGLATSATAGVQSQRAAGVADAAALAAADALAGFAAGDPCTLAHQVASAQGATVTGCDIDGLVATVSIAVVSPALPAAATARAGPPS